MRAAPLTAVSLMSGPLETLLRQVLEGQARIETKLDAALARDRQPDSDPDEALLVLAIATSLGGQAFTAADLRGHARLDADLARVLGDRSVRQIGKRLRRMAGRTVAGLYVRRIKRESGGVLWHVSVAH